MIRPVLEIDRGVCIDCGLCRETCPFGVVVSAFTVRHHYEILAHRCQWCGGLEKAPCDVFCPVPGAIVRAEYDDGVAPPQPPPS